MAPIPPSWPVLGSRPEAARADLSRTGSSLGEYLPAVRVRRAAAGAAGAEAPPLQGELLARGGTPDPGILTYLALRGLENPLSLRGPVFIDLYA